MALLNSSYTAPDVSDSQTAFIHSQVFIQQVPQESVTYLHQAALARSPLRRISESLTLLERRRSHWFWILSGKSSFSLFPCGEGSHWSLAALHPECLSLLAFQWHNRVYLLASSTSCQGKIPYCFAYLLIKARVSQVVSSSLGLFKRNIYW